MRLKYADGTEEKRSWRQCGSLRYRRNCETDDFSAEAFELSDLPFEVWPHHDFPDAALHVHLQFELDIPRQVLGKDLPVSSLTLEGFESSKGGGGSVAIRWPQCFQV